MRNGPSKEFESVVFEVATRANDHLISARTYSDSVPTEAIKIMLHATPCQQYLNRLEKVNFDIFEPKLMLKSLSIPFQIWWNGQQKKF